MQGAALPPPHTMANEGEGELIGEQLVIGEAAPREMRGRKVAGARRRVGGGEALRPPPPPFARKKLRQDPLRHLGGAGERRLDGVSQTLLRQPLGQGIERFEIG